ncbi:hypothetical protein DFH09DRAFT_220747 [Mycena vulgaris]|nr:hypothetical protein DFH09DRAFT_220747 [Mycena vulgaris]
MEFYQLGGFDAAIYSYPKCPLGQKVYDTLQRHQNRGDGSLELVLGIKRSGTSHLLLTKDEKDFLKQYVVGTLERVDRENFERRRFSSRDAWGNARNDLNRTLLQWKDKPCFPNNFESLSPILFRDLPELEAKLEALKPKPGKTSARDTSSMNKAYLDGGQHGAERGRFENSRVFYRVLQNQMNKHKFALGDTSWTSTVRVFSFCSNLWLGDQRSPQERKNLPRVLDVAWCELPTPTLDGEMKMSQHIVVKNNQNLLNPGKMDEKTNEVKLGRMDYEYADTHGETTILEAKTVAERARDFFGKYSELTGNPVVLLIHNKQTTMDVLTSFGIDMSKWEFELRNLLRPEVCSSFSSRVGIDEEHQPIAPRRQAPNDPRRLPSDSRGRSASPRPHDRSRRESPPRRYAPVYMVDVQAMFVSVVGASHDSGSVPNICRRMALFNKEGWCAGNECWMLADVFLKMTQRSAVDDQRKEWPELRAQTLAKPEDESDYEGSDSD